MILGTILGMLAASFVIALYKVEVTRNWFIKHKDFKLWK